MKSKEIRFGGKPLGRPKKLTEANAEQIKQEKIQRRQDALDRIPVEGKFGQGKNGYRLNYIRAKTLKTSEAWINSIFLVMNLMVLIRICLCSLLDRFLKGTERLFEFLATGIRNLVPTRPVERVPISLMA